jgi:hypothetical protein
MWTGFEWEKGQRDHICFVSLAQVDRIFDVIFCNACSDPRDYLKHAMKLINTPCLTPEGALSGDCDFLSANLYARSLFGDYRRLFIRYRVLMVFARYIGEDALKRWRQVTSLAISAFATKPRVSRFRWGYYNG